MGIKKQEQMLTERFFNQKYVEYEVCGEMALFADPLISAGGEKTTYSVPTYEALKGITKSIYWKPTFIWYIDKVRIINRIRTETIGTRLPKTETIGTRLPKTNMNSPDLANYTYLVDVKYQVSAHLEWNKNRNEYVGDRDEMKHYGIFAKSLLRGGRMPVFLGKSECSADVSPCMFGEGSSEYDHSGIVNFGYMYHGITYPDEAYSDETRGKLTLDYAPVTMENGVISFKKPFECIHKVIREGMIKIFASTEVKNGISE